MFAPRKQQQWSIWASILGVFKHHSASGGVLMLTIVALGWRVYCHIVASEHPPGLGLKCCLDPDQKLIPPMFNRDWNKWISIGLRLHLEAFWPLLIPHLEFYRMEVNVTFCYLGVWPWTWTTPSRRCRPAEQTRPPDARCWRQQTLSLFPGSFVLFCFSP